MAESERVLILAPIGRDAALIANTLRDAELEACPCAGLHDFLSICGSAPEQRSSRRSRWRIRGARSHAIGARASLPGPTFHSLCFLASGGDVPPFETFGNVTLLERPLRGVTLVTAVKSALARAPPSIRGASRHRGAPRGCYSPGTPGRRAYPIQCRSPTVCLRHQSRSAGAAAHHSRLFPTSPTPLWRTTGLQMPTSTSTTLPMAPGVCRR